MKPSQQHKPQKTSCRSERVSWQQMNRKQRREMTRKMHAEDLSLEVVHPHAAGIDIGNEAHYVAVPPDWDNKAVWRFGCTTAELKDLAVWLKQCGIRTAAMQSTGVYWIAVYDILEAAGLEVYLVNARETKNLPGHKSDVRLPRRSRQSGKFDARPLDTAPLREDSFFRQLYSQTFGKLAGKRSVSPQTGQVPPLRRFPCFSWTS